jgi:AraC-like DNA-binding protein
MKNYKHLFGLVLITGLLFTMSCKEDEEPAALTVTAITATGIDVKTGESTTVDLNGATVAEEVPVSPVVTITFSAEVDETTVSESTVNIEGATYELAVNGMDVVATVSEELPRGTNFELSLGTISSVAGGSLTATTRGFKTGGRAPVVAPQEESQLAFWKFDGDGTDETGTYDADAEVAVEYVTDRHGEAASTALFDGDATIIEVNEAAGLMVENSSWTISLWMNIDTLNNLNAEGTGNPGQFVFGLGAFYGFRMESNGTASNISLATTWEIEPDGEDPYTRGEGFSFNGDGIYNATGGWRGHTFEEDLAPQGGLSSLLVSNWKHVVFTYDAPSLVASIYIDGQLMKEQSYLEYAPHPQEDCVGWKYNGEEPNVFPDLAFGWVQSRRGELWNDTGFGNYDIPTSNHYKGMLDDFRIFSAAYTSEDVLDLYNAEKP